MTTTYATKAPASTVPATEKQVSYLTSLMKSKENPTVVGRVQYAIATQCLTKALASESISALLGSPKKVVEIPVVTEPETPVYGYYDTETGAYHFDEFKSKYGSAKMPKVFKLAVLKTWDGKAKGKWIYQGGTYKAKQVLTGKKAMTQAEAGAYGLAHGFCIRCGRTLTDPHSVAKGIGPVCITYAGWGV